MSDLELPERIQQALDAYVVPLVAADGGEVVLVSVSEDEVVISLEGACFGCPARSITRDDVIAPLLAAEIGRPIAVRLA